MINLGVHDECYVDMMCRYFMKKQVYIFPIINTSKRIGYGNLRDEK
jgi:hypothetical protein